MPAGAGPADAPVYSFWHVDGDPACSGAQQPESESESETGGEA